VNVAEFAAKWRGSTRSERSASQEHFIDLCNVLGAPTPNEDPTGEDYAFEKGAEKTGGGDGFADVYAKDSGLLPGGLLSRLAVATVRPCARLGSSP
jgi:hypothetical protein